MILGIYGAGGLGREVLELAKFINKRNNFWSEFIFVDDGDVSDVVGNVDVYKYADAREKYGDQLEIALGIGEPETREKIFAKLRKDGVNTPTLIHPDVYIPETTNIGRGVVIQCGSFVSCNVTIGDYVFIQPHANVGHDDVLQEGVIVSSGVCLSGINNIGKYTYIGVGACTKQVVNIGSYAIIGMGSIVYKDIPDEMIVMGNPARPIRRNEEHRVFK